MLSEKVKMVRSGDTIVFKDPIVLSSSLSCSYFKLSSKKRSIFLSTDNNKLYLIKDWQRRDFDFLRV
jgi:hypothetical protein